MARGPAAHLSVEELIARCAQGDKNALRALYDAEAPKMLGIAMRMMKRRALAEEVVQDAFLRLWNAAASFDGTAGHGRAFLYTILRNRALNILRGEARMDLTDNLETLDHASEEETPEQAILRLSEASALHRCLKQLDAQRQAIIALAYTEGLSHGEIAARLSLPLGSIKSWLRRALLTLRECLQ